MAAGEAAGENRVAAVVAHPHLALEDAEQAGGVAQIGISGAVGGSRLGGAAQAVERRRMDRDHLGGEHAFQGVARADVAHRGDGGAHPVRARLRTESGRIECGWCGKRERQIVHQPAMHPGIARAGGAAQRGVAVGEAQDLNAGRVIGGREVGGWEIGRRHIRRRGIGAPQIGR
jgi:hypothetical protein